MILLHCVTFLPLCYKDAGAGILSSFIADCNGEPLESPKHIRRSQHAFVITDTIFIFLKF